MNNMKKILIILFCFVSVAVIGQQRKTKFGAYRIDSLYGNLEVSTDTSGRYVIMKDATTGKTYQGPRMGNVGGGGGGGGSVTTVSVVNTNGFDGTVANATTTPAITIKTTITGLLKGNGTAISAATLNTDYLSSASTINNTTAPSADFSMNSHKITSVLDPTNPQDAATKAYSDALVSGVQYKASVKYATTAALAANTYNNGAGTITMNAVGIIAIDGNNTVLNDEVLIKDEGTQSHNGIYKVTTQGTAGVAGVFTRRTDYDAGSEVVAGTTVSTTAGSTLSNTIWTQITTGTITIGTTALVFSQTGGGSIANNSITNAKLAQMGAHTFKGNNTGSTANVIDLTATELTAELNAFTSSLKGLVPASGGTSTNYLSADGTFTNPLTAFLAQSNTYSAGSKQVFDANTTNADIRLTGHTADPSSLSAGDMWYESTTNTFRVRMNASSRTLSTDDATAVLTNKRITKRSGTVASSATPTINTDNVDLYTITALTVAITSMTTNLSGTPVEGDYLEIWITGTAARAITWGASFADGTVALPTTTVTTQTMMVLLQRKGSLWVCKAAASSTN
jgi:hypothetical protein